MFLQPPLFEEKVHLRVREQPLCSTNPLAKWVVEIVSVVPVNFSKKYSISKLSVIFCKKIIGKKDYRKKGFKIGENYYLGFTIASVFEVKLKKITYKVNFFLINIKTAGLISYSITQQTSKGLF